jgi:SAM-dependent methyltransferase
MNRWLFGEIIPNLKIFLMSNCKLCNSEDITTFFTQKNIPVFQNRIYSELEDSLAAEISDVVLSQCNNCKFVFNSRFDPDLLNYDGNYQNEQANSGSFVEHLHHVHEKLKMHDIQRKKVIEIGCGKGFFLQLLKREGINITGFDPAYEGTDTSIIKDYFSSNYRTKADMILLRHTLEHINNPLEFLHKISSSNNNKGIIYIEVPTFDWIFRNKSFEDIFYEHCNYFTIDTLSMLFDRSVSGYLFNDQYIYLIANLSDLRKQAGPNQSNIYSDNFSPKIRKYKSIIGQIQNLAIWGAGAKGSTFLNLLDPFRRNIKVVVDINHIKQNKYIAHTGHKIISPVTIKDYSIDNIIVMNQNYFEEIKKSIGDINIRLMNINDYDLLNKFY